jgi:hypothetical protein
MLSLEQLFDATHIHENVRKCNRLGLLTNSVDKAVNKPPCRIASCCFQKGIFHCAKFLQLKLSTGKLNPLHLKSLLIHIKEHMKFRLTALSLSLALLAGMSVQVHAADAPAAKRNLREHLYQIRIPHPDARRREAVHHRLRAEGRQAAAYPFLMQRTPYSAGVQAQGELRYGVDWVPEAIGPSRSSRMPAISS